MDTNTHEHIGVDMIITSISTFFAFLISQPYLMATYHYLVTLFLGLLTMCIIKLAQWHLEILLEKIWPKKKKAKELDMDEELPDGE